MTVSIEARRRERRKAELSRQHQDWWEVMSKQVEENLAKHRRRVKQQSDQTR